MLVVFAMLALGLGMVFSPGPVRQALFMAGMTLMGTFMMVQVYSAFRFHVFQGPSGSFIKRRESPVIFWTALPFYAICSLLFGVMPWVSLIKKAFVWGLG
ncbi:hypothetical protein BTJ49_05525 [Oleiagrimonas sp. MCCC 1A03011]|nr:hypothetical protein BTJ49_05525 [Oleiagrimonas sp. MCCC 1A03011]